MRPKIVLRSPKGIRIDITANEYCKKYTLKQASRNWPWSWYVMLTSKNENLMVQFTGNRCDRSFDTRFGKKKEIPVLIPIVSILQELLRRSIVCSCYSRTHWRRCDRFGLMEHVGIPFEWKEFEFHRGCSFNGMSILDAGLMTGGKERMQGRQTVFFTSLDPWRDETEEEFDGVMSSSEQKRKIKIRFEIMSVVPWEKMIHEKRNTGKAGDNTTIGRQKTQQKVRIRENIVPFCIDDRNRKRIENLTLLADGQKNIVGTCTILQLLTYHASQHEKSDQGMNTYLFLNSMMGSIYQNVKPIWRKRVTTRRMTRSAMGERVVNTVALSH